MWKKSNDCITFGKYIDSGANVPWWKKRKEQLSDANFITKALHGSNISLYEELRKKVVCAWKMSLRNLSEETIKLIFL
jgi:hypothetical protein